MARFDVVGVGVRRAGSAARRRGILVPRLRLLLRIGEVLGDLAIEGETRRDIGLFRLNRFSGVP